MYTCTCTYSISTLIKGNFIVYFSSTVCCGCTALHLLPYSTPTYSAHVYSTHVHMHILILIMSVESKSMAKANTTLHPRLTSPHSRHHLVRRHSQFLADLGQGQAVHLADCRVSQWEQVVRQTHCEPGVVSDALDGYSAHWVHLGGGGEGKGEKWYMYTAYMYMYSTAHEELKRE